MGSILKHVQEVSASVVGESDNLRLLWGRAEHDDMPFVGEPGTLYKEDEYEQRTREIETARYHVLDLSEEKNQQHVQTVLDNVANEWWRLHLLHHYVLRQADGSEKLMCVLHYTIPYRKAVPPVYG